MEKTLRFLVASTLMVSLSFVVNGCGKPTVSDTGEMAPVEQVEQVVPPVDKGYDEGMASKEEPLDSSLMSGANDFDEARTSRGMLPIYFDFDKSNIRSDQRPRIEKNAQYLKSNASARIKIEGNCDERGTNEYNMALGERRALNAKKYLENLGIDGNRILTTSYGEEKPLNYGHDELSWSQNRRDDFVISR